MQIQHVYWQVPRSSNPRPAYAVPGLGETLYARGEQVLATAHLCIQSSHLHGDAQRVGFPFESRLDSTAELLADLVHSSIPGIVLHEQEQLYTATSARLTSLVSRNSMTHNS